MISSDKVNGFCLGFLAGIFVTLLIMAPYLK